MQIVNNLLGRTEKLKKNLNILSRGNERTDLALFISPARLNSNASVLSRGRHFLFHVAQISRVQTPADAILSNFRFCFGVAAVWGGWSGERDFNATVLTESPAWRQQKSITRLHQDFSYSPQKTY